MKQIYTDVHQFRGSHFEFGYMQGTKLKNSFLVHNRDRQWIIRKPRFEINLNETKQIFMQFAPFIWDELEGLKNALNWEMQRVLLEFGGYRLNVQRSGCSIFVGKDYLIRNYDYHPKTYDGRYMIYQPNDGGYATIGVSQRVTGRSDGMNEKGLTLGYTFINRKQPGDGFVCHMIGRLVLELCANKEEAIDLLKEIPHRGSFSYVLFDRNSNIASIVETSPRGVSVRHGNTCTNHFESMPKENRHFLNDSTKRLTVMDEHQHLKLASKDAFELLNQTDKGLFSDQYHNWAGTIHTSAYFPITLKTWFALGGDQSPTEFNFADWINGEDFSVSRVEGQVDTAIPFLHMEKADWFRKQE